MNNVGNITATISNSSLSAAPGYLSISQNSCGNSLSAKESCVVTLKLGATVSAVNESGVSYLNTTYSGGQASNATASGEIDYHVLNSQQKFTVTSVTSTNSSSGNGQNSNTPYIFNGANPTGQSIIFTYENQGTQAIQLTGINDSNSPVSWSLDKTNSTCYSSGSLPSGTINIGESCTVIYKNVLYNNAHTGVINLGSSYTENIITPTISFVGLTTNNQYSQQSDLPAPFNGTSAYVTGNQATIANVVSLVNKQLTITNTLTNGAGYSDIMVNSQTENYFINNTPNSSANCTPTFNASSGTVTQSCTLSSSVESASVSYSVDSNTYAGDSFNVLFSIINDNSQTVGMTPVYASQNISDASYAYYANANTTGYTYCNIDQSTNTLNNCQVESTFGSLSVANSAGFNITISNGVAYISNIMNNNYTQCSIDPASALLTNCAIGNNAALSGPFASLVIGNYIYFGNTNSSNISQCSVNAINGTLSNCSTYTPTGIDLNIGAIQQISFNNGYVYMINDNANVTICSVGGNGILSSCTNNALPSGVTSTSGIMVNNNLAYVSVSDNASNIKCQINAVNGSLSACSNSTDPLLASNITYQISENNGSAYLNAGNANPLYIQCNINSSDGSLENCKQNSLPSIIFGQIAFN